MKTWLLALLFILGGISLNAQASVPAFKKAMIIILENTKYDEAIKLPFLSRFAAQGALLADMHAETHPSQPNYIALIAGDTYKVKSDDNVDLHGPTIANLLEKKGKSWKVYAEQYPQEKGCFLESESGTYVRKHVPFLSFKSVQTHPDRCQNIVNASSLAQDIKNDTLPDFSLYIPDLNNDGHDTGATFADRWLAKVFDPLMKNPSFMKDLLLVITFDENDRSEATNQIYTALVGSGIKPGSVSRHHYDHYSLLRTLEDAFDLGNLGLHDANAEPITGIWK